MPAAVADGKDEELLAHGLHGPRIILIQHVLAPGDTSIAAARSDAATNKISEVDFLGCHVFQEVTQQRAGKRQHGNRHQKNQVKPHHASFHMADEVHRQMVMNPQQSAVEE